MSRTVPSTTAVTEAPAMQIGTAMYEGRHRADDPYRILNHRPVAAPRGRDYQPRRAAEEYAGGVDFRQWPSPAVRADLDSTQDGAR